MVLVSFKCRTFTPLFHLNVNNAFSDWADVHSGITRAWVKCELRVAKLRVGILRVEVRVKRASIGVKCETVNVRGAY